MKLGFRMNSDMQYVIYGAGGDCYHTLDILQKALYKVTAIIDKRAKTLINIRNIPVYTFEEYECLDPNKTIFIITIKNVFEHIDVVKNLIKKDCCNIIYKPLPVLQNQSDAEWDCINDAYEYLIVNRSLVPKENEITKSRLNHLEVFTDNLFISKDNNRIICWLPIELIFNYNTEDTYGKMHMGAYYPLVNLYKYLLGQVHNESWEAIKNDFLLYAAEWVAKTGQVFTNELKESLLHSRISVFEEMQKKSEIDRDFFLRSAVDVICGNHFQFYLNSSGRNRVAFMIAKGYRYIPVRMEAETYQSWLRHPVSEEIKALLKDQDNRERFTTILHPLFTTVNVKVQDYCKLFSMPILSELYRSLHWQSVEQNDSYKIVNTVKFLKIKKDFKIYISLNDEGNLMRSIFQEGFDCYWENYDNNELTINSCLNKLFDISNTLLQSMQSHLDYLCQCHVLIIESKKINEFYLNNFKGNIIILLLWGNQEEYLNLYFRKGFYLKKCLFRTLWNEEKVCGIMLIKD